MLLSMSKRAIYPERSHPNLLALRKAFGISQDELGYLTGIPQSRLSRAERGLLWLGYKEMQRVAAVLKVEPEALDKVEPHATKSS